MPTQQYRTKGGKKVKGVTTVLGVLAKNALTYWGYTQGLENYNKITEAIIKIVKEDPPKCRNKEIEYLITNFQVGGLYDKRDKAATAGTLAHLFCEKHLRGLPEPSTEGLPKDVVKKAEGCYLAFLEWERSHKFKMIYAELSLVSELGFGGTADIGAVLGEMGIIDIKTSKGIYPATMLPQISAYGHLYNEHYPENPVKGYHIIRLGEQGEFEHRYWPELEDAWEIFLNCLNIQNKLDKNGWKL
jgi:hypothetical protein